MNDVFDDVMDMENQDLAMTETVEAEATEANFNESELQDIMAEIDNLEKDFSAEGEIVNEDSSSATLNTPESKQEMDIKPKTTSIIFEAEPKGNIVADPQSTMSTTSKNIAEAPEKIDTKVLFFEKKSAPIAGDTMSNVTLNAAGDMSLNLTFKIGSENATLVIDQEKGLLVSYSGVNLSLHAENGCTLQMENGVSLTVPVQSNIKANKKAV